MYKKIVVTLDRSDLAEQALNHAVAMAEAFDAEIDLLMIVPVTERDARRTVNVDWDAEIAEDEEYLAGVNSRVAEAGVAVHTELRRGNVAEEILHYVDKSDADLLVLSTHGRSGRGRWVYGSIADRVLRYSSVPVLLIRATEK
ncbi:MAG: universal stress protein [Armatimonadota bacterium]